MNGYYVGAREYLERSKIYLVIRNQIQAYVLSMSTVEIVDLLSSNITRDLVRELVRANFELNWSFFFWSVCYESRDEISLRIRIHLSLRLYFRSCKSFFLSLFAYSIRHDSAPVRRGGGEIYHPRVPALSPALMISRYPRLWFQSAGHDGIWRLKIFLPWTCRRRARFLFGLLDSRGYSRESVRFAK